MKKIFLLTILLFTKPALSQVDNSFKELMNTPVTAFDLFLYRLYENAQCHAWPGYRPITTLKCMNSFPQYNPDNNELILELSILPDISDEKVIAYLKKFKSAPKEQKLKMLRAGMDTLMGDLGLTKSPKNNKKRGKVIYGHGLLDNSWIQKNFSKKTLSKIKDNTIVNVRFAISKPTEYWDYKGKRDKNGNISVEIINRGYILSQVEL